MKIALIGASGNAGSRLLTELTSRGHAVTAIARHPEKVAARSGVTVVAADMRNATELTALLKGHDAVISSVRFVTTDVAALIAAVKASGVARYLVVGGAGSLEVAPGVKLLSTADFPAVALSEATAGGHFLDLLRAEKELDWVFLSPSARFAAGERTGKFRLGGDQLLTGEKGSFISFEDFAVAMVDEIEKPAHHRERFTVGY